MIMPTSIPEDIILRIKRDFPKDEAAPIIELLNELKGRNPDYCDRILRSIIHLAHGSFDQFERAVTLADLDWRDLIVAAEYDGRTGEEDKRRDLTLPFDD